MACKIPGCYKSVKGQDYVDFLIKAGTPEDEAKKLLGSHWTFKFGRVEGESNKWVWWVQCDEVPEMNWLDSAIEGVEKAMDQPMVGGKAKMVFNKTGPNSFKTVFDTEAYGEMITLENYEEEGYYLETSMKGVSLKEFWPRYVNESGFFKFDKSENLEGYGKAQGMPDEMIDACKNMTLHQKICGNKIWLKETFGSFGVNTNTGTLDEECTYKWVVDPQYSRKYVMTRVAPGKFKCISKSPDGRVEEVDSIMSEEGIFNKMTDKMSGEVCNYWMKRYVPFEGKYKMVATAGLEEFFANQDVPKDMVEKIQSENPILTICNKDGNWHYKFDSKTMPMEMAVPLNKEFEFTNPLNKKTNKLFCTIVGDTFKEVAKSDKCTVVATMKFGETFVINTSEILGLGIKCKIIYQRLC